MFTCIGWRIKTPKTSFEKFNQLVQGNIPAEFKQPREYWQIKDRVNKRGQQLSFIDYYELPPYVWLILLIAGQEMIGISKRNKAAPVFGPGRTYGATGHITQMRYLLAFKNSMIMFLESLQSILDRITEEELIPAEQKVLAEL